MHRWLLLLEEYNYKLKHITSPDNCAADTLSRSMMVRPRNNKKLEEVISLIANINDNQSKRKSTSDTYSKLDKLHFALIHPGKNKMVNTLKNYLTIKNLKKLVADITKKCHQCHVEKD
ncbi:hypothetical protein EQH57_0242 [Dictyocoela roeselum]|nr:hypothetical protein EQH57_0242 [Dictyocoela roeselum]